MDKSRRFFAGSNQTNAVGCADSCYTNATLLAADTNHTGTSTMWHAQYAGAYFASTLTDQSQHANAMYTEPTIAGTDHTMAIIALTIYTWTMRPETNHTVVSIAQP
jgi:hypothetical protein